MSVFTSVVMDRHNDLNYIYCVCWVVHLECERIGIACLKCSRLDKVIFTIVEILANFFNSWRLFYFLHPNASWHLLANTSKTMDHIRPTPKNNHVKFTSLT